MQLSLSPSLSLFIPLSSLPSLPLSFPPYLLTSLSPLLPLSSPLSLSPSPLSPLSDTPQFVDVLFSSLDSESYMSPGRHGSSSTNISNNNQQSSNTGGAGDGRGDGRVSPSYDRRISEDSRHKEVYLVAGVICN